VKKLVPFELKRAASVIGIIVALVVTGILTNLGELKLTSIVEVFFGVLPTLGERVLAILFFKFEVNVLGILAGLLVFVLVLFPVCRYVDRFLMRRVRRELIGRDTFASNTGTIAEL
jgi:hypothetical protein